MSRQQLAAVYGDTVADAPAQVEATVTQLVTSPTATVFVAERDGLVIGMIGLMRYVHHASGLPTAGEVMWWVEPEARGRGVALLTRAERWAAETGAQQIQMVAPATNARVGRLYERRGYRAIETSYQAPVTPAMTALTVVDDVLRTWTPIARPRCGRCSADGGADAGRRLPRHRRRPSMTRCRSGFRRAIRRLTPTLNFVRQSPAGQVEPNFIHTDADMGDWTALYYLTADPAARRWHDLLALARDAAPFSSTAAPGSDEAACGAARVAGPRAMGAVDAGRGAAESPRALSGGLLSFARAHRELRTAARPRGCCNWCSAPGPGPRTEG